MLRRCEWFKNQNQLVINFLLSQVKLFVTKATLIIHNWELLTGRVWESGSIGFVKGQSFFFFEPTKELYFDIDFVKYSWLNNYSEILVSLDTNLPVAVQTIKSENIYKYLIDLLNNNYQTDVLELVSITRNQAILFSKGLQ